MDTFNIHYAKTHLSRLIEKAAKGEAFIIAKAGKPLVKVVPLDAPAPHAVNPIGFMRGRIRVPEDFDRMGEDDIVRLFQGASRDCCSTRICSFERRRTRSIGPNSRGASSPIPRTRTSSVSAASGK